MKYRPEIDGLRAVAVIPVILFHAGFDTFRGGFAGVDVFFVISGYLITSIILNETETNSFSLLRFYERRARRILPALFLVMIACIPFAWSWMLPDDLENFGQSLVSTVLFSNNILLWLTSGYWGLANEFKPLLHTWSLGVEEQFYIFYPLILLLMLRLEYRLLFLATIVITIASIVVFELTKGPAVTGAFLLLPYRFWELMLGGAAGLLLAKHGETLLPAPAARQILSLIGGLLIIAGMAVLNDPNSIIGVEALLPTIGTLLIILYAGPDNFVGRFLSHRIAVFFGLISYSAYLWHQPIFAFHRIKSLDEPSVLSFWIIIIASFMIAYLSWRFVERPFRDAKQIPTKLFVRLMLALAILIGSTGAALHFSSGFPSRWGGEASGIADAGRGLNAAYNQQIMKLKEVPFTDPQKRNVLVLGDSFARDFVNAGIENGYFSKVNLSYTDTNYPGCISGPSDPRLDPVLLNQLEMTDTLIVSMSSYNGECLLADIHALEQIGVKNVLVIGVKNFGWNMNAFMLLDPAGRPNYRAKILQQTRDDNEQNKKIFGKRYYVDVISLLSDDGMHIPVFTPDGHLISQDRMHLTKPGAKYYGERVFNHPLLETLK